MAVLNWNVTKAEHDLIYRIAIRAEHLATRMGVEYLIRDALMDLTACHANACKLDLADLAAAPDGDFAHDVFGIRNHLNRDTGRLEDCFLPRYADRSAQ